MPPGAPYHSFIRPYPIRVDAFATPDGAANFTPPALYLLTHTHTDHIVGLSSLSFGGVVVCSPAAKEMLLRWEPSAERVEFDLKKRKSKFRPCSHLRIKPTVKEGKQDFTFARDLLRAIPLNFPTNFELSATLTVRITALDANHCPGSVMFLVEGPQGAVLHTGDVRSEPCLIESLRQNPILQRFIPYPNSEWPAPPDSPMKTLEAIYIDTASLTQTETLPTKQEATTDLIDLMELFNSDTKFFINCWTWGYEDVLKAVARRFASKIHVDRYKGETYQHCNDLFLQRIISRSQDHRFHACERFNLCAAVLKDIKDIVSINPVEMGLDSWRMYKTEIMQYLAEGKKVTNIMVPLARHSGLQELQSLVSLFRPKQVVPNSLIPTLHGLDWVCMPTMFEPYLAPGGADQMRVEIESAKLSVDRMLQVVDVELPDVDVENVQGEGAKELATIWLHKDHLDGYQTLFERIQPYFPKAMLEYMTQDRKGKLMKEKDSAYGSSEDEEEDGTQDREWRKNALGIDAAASTSSVEGRSVLLLENYSSPDEDKTLDVNAALEMPEASGKELQLWSPIEKLPYNSIESRSQLGLNLKRKRSTEQDKIQRTTPKRRHTDSFLQKETIDSNDAFTISKSDQFSHTFTLSASPSQAGVQPSPKTAKWGASLQGLKVTPETLARTMDLRARIAAAKARNRSNSPVKRAENQVISTKRNLESLSRQSSAITLSLQDDALSSSNPSLQLTVSSLSSATRSDGNAVPPSSIEDSLPQGADLERTRSLLDGLIHKKIDWPSFTSIGSQTD